MGNIRLTNFCQPTNLVTTKEKFSFQFPNYTREILREGKASISSNVFDMINFIKNGTEQEAITLLTDVLDYENDANTAKLVRVIKQNTPNDLRPMINKLRIENTQAFETAPQQEKPFDLLCGYASLTDFVQSFENYFDFQTYNTTENIHEYIADIAVKRVSEYNNMNETELVGNKSNLEWLLKQYHPTFKNRVHSVFSAIYQNQKSHQLKFDVFCGYDSEDEFFENADLTFVYTTYNSSFSFKDGLTEYVATVIFGYIADYNETTINELFGSNNNKSLTYLLYKHFSESNITKILNDVKETFTRMEQNIKANYSDPQQFVIDYMCGGDSKSLIATVVSQFNYEYLTAQFDFTALDEDGASRKLMNFMSSYVLSEVCAYNDVEEESIFNDDNEYYSFVETNYSEVFARNLFNETMQWVKSQGNVQADYDIYAGQPNKGQFLRMMKELPFDYDMYEEMDDVMAFTAFKVLQHVAYHASKPSSQIMSPTDANVTAWFERVYDDAVIIDLRSHYKNMAEKERASRNGENEFNVLCGTGSESKFVEYMQSLLNTFDYENFVRFNGGSVREFVASEIAKQVAEYNGMDVEVMVGEDSNEDWVFNAYTLDVVTTLADWFKITFSIDVGAIEISNNINWNSGDIDLLAGENRLEDFIDIVVAKSQSLTIEAQKAYQNGTMTDFVAEIVADIVADYNNKKTSEWYVEYGSTFEWFKSNYADNQILQIVEEVEKRLGLSNTSSVNDNPDFDGLIDENDIDLSFI